MVAVLWGLWPCCSHWFGLKPVPTGQALVYRLSGSVSIAAGQRGRIHIAARALLGKGS